MSQYEMSEEDRYRRLTDRIRNKLIDGVEKILGGSERFQERFGISPAVARSSRDEATRLFTVWGLLYCNNETTGSTITKVFIDDMKTVTSARDTETAQYKSKPNSSLKFQESTLQHEHFNKILKDLTRMFVEADLRYHPAAVSPVKLPVLENALQSLDLGFESDGMSRSGSEIHPNQVSNGSLIETALPEQIESSDFTQADVVGKNDPSLDAFCDTTERSRDAVMHTWNEVTNERATFARAGLVTNFAIHLLEVQADDWYFTEVDEQGKRRTAAKEPLQPTELLVALTEQRSLEKEARRKDERSTKNERLRADLESAKKYSEPVVSILLQHQTGSIDPLYRHNLLSDSDLPKFGDGIRMGVRGDIRKLDPRKPLLVDQYSYHLKATQAVMFLREFGNLGKADAAPGGPCFPVTDILTRSMSRGLRDRRFHAQDAIALEWLLSVNRLSGSAKKEPYELVGALAQRFRKSILYLNNSDQTRIAGGLKSAVKLAGAMLDDVAQDRDRRSAPAGSTTKPASLLKQQHFLGSTLSFRLLLLARSNIAKLEEGTPRILYTVHLYNMARTVAGLEVVWDELELLIKQLGVKKLFGRDTLPTTWSEIYQALECVRRDRAAKAYLRPSELMFILDEYTLDPSAHNLRRLQAYIIRNKFEPTPGQSEMSKDLKQSLAPDPSGALTYVIWKENEGLSCLNSYERRELYICEE